jgi:hypothetical protein
MTAPAWYNDGKKLIEGETYTFNFIKIIPLSDNMNYMQMEDPFGIRHLVPYEFYSQYGLKPGNTVICRVDKINCTGRVFLEPEHPYYKSGESTLFKISRFEYKSEPDIRSVIIVMDIFGNEISIELENGSMIEQNASHLLCVVNGFKKGKPVLTIIYPMFKED